MTSCRAADVSSRHGVAQLSHFDALGVQRPRAVQEVWQDRDAGADAHQRTHRLQRTGAQAHVRRQPVAAPHRPLHVFDAVGLEHDQRRARALGQRRALESGEQIGQVVARHQAGHADGQAAGEHFRLAAVQLRSLGDGCDHLARAGLETVPVLGQHHPPGLPLEELHAQLFFQRQYSICDCRLRHAFTGGRHRELTATRCSHEIPQLPEGDVVGGHGLVCCAAL